MCTILFAYKAHPKYPLIVAANRDEFYERPTKEAHYWESHEGVLAGRDLKACGTWLGLHTSGRFGALTNFRDFRLPHGDKTSRGEIVLNYLMDQNDTTSYMDSLKVDKAKYDPYNALFYEGEQMYYINNITGQYHSVEPGVHGLSNQFLDTPWFKVRKGRQRLQEIIQPQAEVDPQVLFELLDDREQAEIIELPDTGMDRELEQVLSSLHIETETYGTRYKSVVLYGVDGTVSFYEKYLDHKTWNWRQHAFMLSMDLGNHPNT